MRHLLSRLSLPTLRRLGGMAALFLMLGAGIAEAGCRIFIDTNYRGRYATIENNGVRPTFSARYNDQVSSIETTPNCRAVVYEHWYYRGRSAVIETSASVRSGDFWNDRISSMRCECGRDRDRVNRPVPRYSDKDNRDGLWNGVGRAPRVSRNGAACVLFSREGTDGFWRAFRDGEAEVKLGDALNQNVSSVRTARGCYALLDTHRDNGRGIYLSGTHRDLRRASDKASTVSCLCR
ncbi:MAG: hypothetical protein AAFV62_00095 [Pseudomonadota bacterium]